MKIRFPSNICLETSSMCNRVCSTCIRNSHPDRAAVKPWFQYNLMPMEMIKEFIRQYIELDFQSDVCLSNFNEPLLDPRIVDIVKMMKEAGIGYVYLVTNGDYLTQEIAKGLDGVLDRITVSLYYDRKTRNEIKHTMRSLFKETKVWIKGTHLVTHFNPTGLPLSELKCKQQQRPNRLIINHRGQYLLCCDDINGVFDLGTFPEINLKEYWFGEKHTRMMKDLLIPGGRKQYAFCSTCPRVW